MAVVEFVTHLPKETYRSGVGWSCSALSIPSSEVSRLVVGDTVLTAEDFLVQDGAIRLAEGTMVEDAEATITVRRTLAAARSSAVVAVAAILVALFALAFAYGTKPTAGCIEAR